MDKTHKRKEKIAVVGAGICGILAIAALREDGFEPVCYEASDKYGGLWNYREESIEGFASLMPTTTINNSKEMGAFSNFPPDKEYSNHMHHRQFFRYLTEYYEHNECGKYIRFNNKVMNLKKAADYEHTGRLSVTVKDTISGEVSTDIFDGVMVATGRLAHHKKENFQGLENFKGEVIHTHSLKHVEKYKDKNVLVVGMGCSALDAAENISCVSKQVYLSCRRGAYVISRMGPNGYPLDYVLWRRYLGFLLDRLPIELCSWYVETFYINPKFNHRLYYVKPKHQFLCQEPSVNDAFHSKLLSGVIKQRGAVKYFTENGVVLDGEETVIQIDAVVLGTGYTFKLPFLEEGLMQIESGRINLYKTVFPTHLPHPTLAFIGWIAPFSAGFPHAEMQSRWVSSTFARKTPMPSNNDMLTEVIRFHEANERRFPPNENMSIRIDYLSYLDDLARTIGCKPNLSKYLFTDFRLFLKLAFGPSVPYQYRLEGPHKWDGAREAIMSCEDRVRWPLSRENRSEKGWKQYILEYIGALIPRNVFIPL